VKSRICATCSLCEVTTSLKPGRRRLRYLAYGPISDAPPADKHKIADLIQRGRPVTDERLVQQALLYARFRARVCGWLGLIFLVIAAGNLAALLMSGQVFEDVLHVAAAFAFVLMGGAYLWLASRSRHGAHATGQASRGRQVTPSK
jgi:hypothetical protein